MSKLAKSTGGTRVEELDGAYDVFPLPADETTLLAILTDCFDEWEHVHVGPLIQGAAWEIRPPRRPKITMLDGYATFDFGDWHCHICIGEHRGAPAALAAVRRTSRAELFRKMKDGAPTFWGLRLLNGADEQQITVLLPQPFLTDNQRPTTTPDWDRLALWDRLRRKYLGLGPDQTDRLGTGFQHD